MSGAKRSANRGHVNIESKRMSNHLKSSTFGEKAGNRGEQLWQKVQRDNKEVFQPFSEASKTKGLAKSD